MLNVDSPISLDGLTLYRDFNDPGLYYYLPDNPELARDGSGPLFQLLIYRRDITDNPDFKEGQSRGGGFLTMTVDLKVSTAKREAVAEKLADLVGQEVRLAQVPFEKGSVRVTALGVSTKGAGGGEGDEAPPEQARPSFVENILGAASPSLYGDNRAVFSIELSAEGAQLMRASLEDAGGSNISVVYDLEYLGLKPAREVTIKIKYHQSYSYLRTRAQVNTLWFKADMDAEYERLKKDGSIEIVDVNYLELEADELSKRAEDLNKLAKELAQWTFFKPGLKPGEVLAKDRGSITVYDPTTAAAAVTAGFTTPLNLMVSGRGRNDDAGRALVGGNTERTRTTTTTSTPTTPTTPTTPAGTTQREPTAVERWNAAGRPQAGFLLKSLNQEEEQEITYNLRQVSAHKRSAAPQGSIGLLRGDSNLVGRIKVVSLDDPFFDRIAGTVTTTADLEAAGVSSMNVAIRYGVREDGSFPANSWDKPLTATGQSHDYEFWMDRRKNVVIEYRVTANYRPDYAIGDTELVHQTGWIATTARNLDIDPRALEALLPARLSAGQVDWGAVSQIQCEVAYRDDDAGLNASRTVVITQDNSTVVVPIRPADPTKREFQVRASYFYTNGTSETVEQTVTRGLDVVLNQPPSKAVPISVSAVDPLGRLAKVTAELSYQEDGQPEQAKLLTLTAGQSENWSFFRSSATASARYRYRPTLFANDGTTVIGDWRETTERQLILGDVFPAMLEVSVEILGDFAAEGVALARLTLEYDHAPDGFQDAAREQEAFRATPTGPYAWKVPSAAAELQPYRWSVDWIYTDRSTKREEGESSDELLILFVAAKDPS